MTTAVSTRGVPVARVAAVAGAGLYAWVASGFRPFTWPAGVFAALPALVLFVLATRAGARHRPTVRAWLGATRAGTTSPGALAWAVLITLAAAVEIDALVQSPRSAHPTLSSLADTLTATHPGRFAAYLLWLALGRGLYRR